MPRTKEDFISYARKNISRTRKPIRSEEYNSGIDGRDEIVGDSVRGTDFIIGQSDEISGRTTETVYDPDADSTRYNEGADTTSTGSNGSDIDIIDGIGPENSSDGDIDRSPYQSNSELFGPTTRTIKTRKTFLDGAMSSLGSKLGGKKSKPVIKKAATTTVRKLLTIGEITHNRPLLIKTILWSSEQMDSGITAITKHHREVTIWSTLEHSDVEILVDALQSAGQKSEWVAARVREIMSYETKIKAATILLPRAAQTIMYLFSTGFDIRMW